MIFAPALALLAAGILVPSTSPKFALVIGVQYRAEAQRLHTKADVNSIVDVLTRVYSFRQDSDIDIRDTEESTSKAGIEAGFQNLINRIPADQEATVFIYYAGHGSQAPDRADPGDGETLDHEVDGMDETICPSEATDSDNRVNDIRDDQIGNWVDAILAKHPKSLTMVFDCCHSGSVFRGPAIRRIEPPGHATLSDGPLFAMTHRTDGMDDIDVHVQNPESDTMLSSSTRASNRLVFMSACASEQKSYETGAYETGTGGPQGAFTAALCQAINSGNFRAAHGQIPVQLLFDETCSILTTKQFSNQTPMVEGATNSYFLDGGFFKLTPYFNLSVEGGSLRVDGGLPAGITAGAVFGVYPATVTDPSAHREERVAGVQVSEDSADSGFSLVRTTDDSKMTLPALRDGVKAHPGQYIAYLEESGLTNSVRVVIDRGLRKSASIDKLKKALSTLKLASVVDGDVDFGHPGSSMPTDFQLAILPDSSDPNQLHFVSPSGRPIRLRAEATGVERAVRLTDDDLAEELRAIVEKRARADFLAQLRVTGEASNISVLMRAVPIRCKPDPAHPKNQLYDGDIEFEPGAPFGNTLKIGDCYCIELMNVGHDDACIQLIDIDSEGKLSPLWPIGLGSDRLPAHQNPADRKWVRLTTSASPGRPSEPMVYRVGLPGGEDIVKLIATEKPFRTDFLFGRDRGELTRGDDGPVARTLALLMDGEQTRDGGSLSADNCCVTQFVLHIAES